MNSLKIVLSLILSFPLLFLALFFTVNPAAAQSPSIAPISGTTQPSFYPLAPCPSCATPSEAVIEPDEEEAPEEEEIPEEEPPVEQQPDVEEPCDAEEAAIAHDRKGGHHSKHHNKKGDISEGIEGLLKLLLELINKLIELLGGTPIENPDSTPNPEEPEEPEAPEDPDAPEQPEAPEDPDAQDPCAPEAPETPEQPEDPGTVPSTVPGISTGPIPSTAVPSGTPVAAGTCKTNLTADLGSNPGISGAIIKNGKVVCTAIAGIADTDTQRPVTPDTAFTWASVTKTFTAVAVMQMVEQGKLKLDDDVSTATGIKVQLSTCPTKIVNYRHLLTHTAGIIDNDAFMPYVPGDSPVLLSEFVPGYLTPGAKYYATANFAGCPGDAYEYSSSGLVTASYAVEKLSGMQFDQYAKTYLFAPLGMDNTSLRFREIDQSKYARPNGNQQPQGYHDYPAGTLSTSPQNLGKYVAAFMTDGSYNGKQLIKPESIQEMLKAQTPVDSSQGLVWNTSTDFDGGATTWGHNGDDPGVKSEMRINLTTKTGVVVAANGDDEEAVSAAMNKLFTEAAGY